MRYAGHRSRNRYRTCSAWDKSAPLRSARSHANGQPRLWQDATARLPRRVPGKSFCRRLGRRLVQCGEPFLEPLARRQLVSPMGHLQVARAKAVLPHRLAGRRHLLAVRVVVARDECVASPLPRYLEKLRIGDVDLGSMMLGRAR